MRVMVLAKTTDDSEKGILPTNEMLEAICKYNEELINAGIMRAGDGLKALLTGQAYCVRWLQSHCHRRAFRRNPRAGRRLLAGKSKTWRRRSLGLSAVPIPCQDRA